MASDTASVRQNVDVATKLRNIRVDERLWAEAMRIAKRRRETLSHVVKAALVEYVLTHGGKLDDE